MRMSDWSSDVFSSDLEFRSSHDRSRGGTPTPRGGCPLGNLMVSDLLANQRGIGQMPGAGSAVRGGACPDKSNLMLGIEVIEIHRQLHCVSGSAMVSQPGGHSAYLPSMAFLWELFGKFQWRSQPTR